jgi:serine/threonine protein kinase
MTLATGSKLGSYQILAPQGAGGMGEVYKARDAKLDGDVAIKVLPAKTSALPRTSTSRPATFGFRQRLSSTSFPVFGNGFLVALVLGWRETLSVPCSNARPTGPVTFLSWNSLH